MCKKRGYLTEEEAKRARKETIHRLGDPGRGLEPYRCNICDRWHLGHPPKWLIERRKKSKRDLEQKIFKKFMEGIDATTT